MVMITVKHSKIQKNTHIQKHKTLELTMSRFNEHFIVFKFP